MEDVPYEFIQRVYAKLSVSTIEEMDVPAPLWQEVARVHHEKLQRYKCAIQITENGLLYGFCRYGTMTVEKAMTLEEFAKLDWRYHRVVEFSIKSPHSMFAHLRNFHPVGDSLTEVMQFVSQCNLEWIVVSEQGGVWKALEFSVLNECCEHHLRTEKLEIIDSTGSDAFLPKLLKTNGLERVNLLGDYDKSLRPHLEAFVCRPNFKALYCPEFQCFDHEGIGRILAFWRSMDVPWKAARIGFGGSKEFRDRICEKLTWMERVPNMNPDTQQFMEVRGDFKAVVVNDYDSLTLAFNIAVTKL